MLECRRRVLYQPSIHSNTAKASWRRVSQGFEPLATRHEDPMLPVVNMVEPVKPIAEAAQCRTDGGRHIDESRMHRCRMAAMLATVRESQRFCVDSYGSRARQLLTSPLNVPRRGTLAAAANVRFEPGPNSNPRLAAQGRRAQGNP